ncbi:MAG TPA: hypothetical protein VN862_04865 [Candidatus Acidoferrales bacterium]|jgi:hypothetical protein|nr:hypothetical protein [Candidatus Acidoferrales bacterium]
MKRMFVVAVLVVALVGTVGLCNLPIHHTQVQTANGGGPIPPTPPNNFNGGGPIPPTPPNNFNGGGPIPPTPPNNLV